MYFRAKLRENRGEPEVRKVKKVKEVKPSKSKPKKVIGKSQYSLQMP